MKLITFKESKLKYLTIQLTQYTFAQNYKFAPIFLILIFKLFSQKMNDNVESHILNRYKLLKKVGSGAYGHVWKVQQIKTNQIFALKKIFDAFQHSTDAQRTYREITLLHQISQQNIVKLHRVIKAQNDKDLYLIFQFMQADLHNAIGQKILKDLHYRYIIYQLVKGIQYLHQSNVIHRDLKPSNLLINSDCSLKICDLGLARTIQSKNSEQEQIFTEQVATRWYRAPEVLLGSQTYGKSADIWSIGCILAEMLTGKPIFPGNSTLNQLQRIVSFTGKPNTEDIDSIESPLAYSMIQSIGRISQKKISELFKAQLNQQAIDLVLRTIHFNPRKRLSAQQILNHPYVRQFNKFDNKENAEKVYLEISQNQKKSVKQYKRLIYNWINKVYEQVNYNQTSKPSISKDKKRTPFKESLNHDSKKIISAKNSLDSFSFIKQTPTYSKKKVNQNLKNTFSPLSYSTKKIFRCNSQKYSRLGGANQEYLHSPVSKSYKQCKISKQSIFNSNKQISIHKSNSLIGKFKQKTEKRSQSGLLNKFSKPMKTQLSFGNIIKYRSGTIKSYV